MNARRLGAASSALAVLLLAYLGPIQSVVWNGERAPQWVKALPWVEASIAVAYTHPPVIPVYDIFGRCALLGYAALIVAFLTVRRDVRTLKRPHSAMGFALLALCGAAAADFVAYWIGGLKGALLRETVFWFIEVPSLVVAALSLTGTGWLLRAHATYRRLLLVPVSTVIATVGLSYMPHGPLLGIAVAVTASMSGQVQRQNG